MDKVWSRLPYDCLERIAHFADIDTRRAMGFPPRKLPPSDFVPRPMPSTEYRYYVNEKKLWYFEMDSYLNFYFDVLTGVELVDPLVPLFRYSDYTCQRITTFSRHEEFQVLAPNWQTFQTAGFPILITT